MSASTDLYLGILETHLTKWADVSGVDYDQDRGLLALAGLIQEIARLGQLSAAEQAVIRDAIALREATFVPEPDNRVARAAARLALDASTGELMLLRKQPS
jgi:hypothetical protein